MGEEPESETGEDEEHLESETGEEEEEQNVVEPINLIATGEEEEEPESETGEEEDEAAPGRRLLDDAKLKRAPTAYISWFNANRKTIKGKNVAEIAKKAGSMWKSLSAGSKKTFEDKAAKAKKAYDDFVATSKGAAALKAYKDAVAKAKAPLSATADKAKTKAKAAKERLTARKKALKEKLAAKKAAKAAKKAASKAAKKAKKLIEIMPDVISVPAGALIGVLLGSGVALAVLQLRRSISTPAEEPLLA